MKGTVTPSMLIALVCGASAQVPELPGSPKMEILPLPAAEGVRIPPDLVLSNVGLREALSVHRNFDYERRSRIDLYLSSEDDFSGDAKPMVAALTPVSSDAELIPLYASMVPVCALNERPKIEMHQPPTVELDFEGEVAEMFGFKREDRSALFEQAVVPMSRPIPEPTSIAALAVGFAGLVRVRLRKSGRLRSRSRR